jgi:eukaryotic-like serine/threonine-protein kinase
VTAAPPHPPATVQPLTEEPGAAQPSSPVLPSPAGLPARFQLLRRLGQGSGGTVFAAWDASSEQTLALKLVQPLSHPGRFEAETRSACSLQHPDIVTTLEGGHDAGSDLGWLVMELVPGVPLQRYTQPARLLPEALALQAAARVAGALAHAHAQGVVHRDVKPANVLVNWPEGVCKLGDFGLARQVDSEATRTGLVMGSPAYMAPELLAGTAPTPGSDIYALGVTLFELLSARLPFDSPQLGELLRQVAQQPAPALPMPRSDLPADWVGDLNALMARLLGKRPADRPSAADLEPALWALAARANAAAAPSAALQNPRQPPPGAEQPPE